MDEMVSPQIEMGNPGTIEDVWAKVVSQYLPSSSNTSLSKKQQQDLAVALQNWAADCVKESLQEILRSEQRDDLQKHIQKVQWQINYTGKDFLGAVRVQEVDVWLTNLEAGLVLAIDPKHFQSADSLGKN